ncbi:EEF1A N-terminal glycine/lysine methyltransferase, partial [Tremellales sp. Uapishka_1]
MLRFVRRDAMDESDAEDPTDIFDTGLSNLFFIPPIAFSTSSPSAFYAYTPPRTASQPIQLRLPDPPANLTSTLQANNLWLSSLYLADLLSLSEIIVDGKHVAELGAGAGLPGIVARRDCAPKSVLSTDWGVEEVLSVITGNFQRNCKGEGQWVVSGHEWGTDVSNLMKEDGRLDVLLLADVIWVTAAHQALLNSVFRLLKPGGVAHITAGLHTGRGPLERFIVAARDRKATVHEVREVKWVAEGGWAPNDMEKDGREEERGVVVYLILEVPS